MASRSPSISLFILVFLLLIASGFKEIGRTQETIWYPYSFFKFFDCFCLNFLLESAFASWGSGTVWSGTWDSTKCCVLIDEHSVVSHYNFGADKLIIRCTVDQTDDLVLPHCFTRIPITLCSVERRNAKPSSLHICRAFCKLCKLLKVRICT